MGDLFLMPMPDVSMCAPLPTVYEAEEFGKRWILHSHQRRMATFVLHLIDKLIRPMSENPYQTPREESFDAKSSEAISPWQMGLFLLAMPLLLPVAAVCFVIGLLVLLAYVIGLVDESWLRIGG